MKNIGKLLLKTLGVVAYLILLVAVWYWCLTAIDTAEASNYVGNFKKIPAVENQPPQVATWKRTPTVIICEYAPVKEEDIDKAVDFWKDLGYRFFDTQYKYDPLKKCSSSTPVGYIVVHLITQGIKLDESSLAETHFFVDNDHNEIEWAIIYLRSNIRETVLEHEIGHALGFLHFNSINHLMNEKWTMGGWEKEGLENKQR